MSKPQTIEEMTPKLIRAYIEEAGRLSEAYNISGTEALLVMTLIELAKIHTHVDGMVDVLQLIKSQERTRPP